MNTALAVREHPFGEIQKGAEDALQKEKVSPTISAEAEERASETASAVVAGFALHDDAAKQKAIDDARQARRAEIEAYYEDRNKLVAELKKRNITPLAMVPASAWERICTESGLCRLCPDEDGRVPLSRALFDKIENRSHVAILALFVVSILATAGVAGKLAAIQFGLNLLPIILSVIVTALISLIVFGSILFGINGGAVGDSFSEKLINLQIPFVARRLKKMPWEMMLKAFLSDMDKSDQKLHATVVLPEPPPDVATTLLKAKGMTLWVAAEAGAFSFVETPEQILLRENARVAEEQRVYRERLMKDPIIYTKEGRAVAIIAQFGDLAIEQEVVNRVMNSQYLL